MLMKLGLMTIFLWASLVSAQTSTPSKVNSQPQQLTIKDPAEFNAYMKVVQMPNSVEKAQAVDGFLAQFPNTVVKAELLKTELYVYQSVKNEDEAVRTAERLLECEPSNLQMLALLASTYRECANRNGANAKMCADNAVKVGRQGLDVIERVQTPPTGMTPEEYETLKAQVRPIFEGVVSAHH
jgi:hypothetical protein